MILLPPRWVAAHLEGHLPPLEDRPLDLVHPVDLALLVARLLDVALVDHAVRPVLEAPDRLLEARDLLLLGDVELLLPVERDLLRHRVRGVVPRPHRDHAAVQLRDLRHGVVQQVPVVRDADDGAREIRDQVLEQLASARVEMGLGLVEQQQVGLADQARGQRHELALAAREQSGRPLEVVPGEPERGEEAPGLPREAGAARRHPAVEQVLLPGEHPGHPVEVRHDLGARQLGLDGAHRGVELGDVRARRQDGLLRRALVALRGSVRGRR